MNYSAGAGFGAGLHLVRLAAFVGLVTSAGWILVSAAIDLASVGAVLECHADREAVTAVPAESHPSGGRQREPFASANDSTPSRPYASSDPWPSDELTAQD